VLGLAAAAASAGLVPPRAVRVPTMGSPTGDAPIVGEHSGAGERRVDELNRAISSMQHLRGEHAGLSRADYARADGLDAR